MVYDSARYRTILFGGWVSNVGYTAEVWEWDGVNWKKLVTSASSSSPEPLYFAAGAYDSLRQRMVVFGGYGDFYHVRANTWGWSGTSWKQLEPVYPGPASGAAMEYDPERQRMVIYGGSDNTNYHTDVWESDGSKWRKVVPTGARPLGSAFRSIAYDADRKVMLHWETSDNPPSSTIWEWDGKSWTRRNNTVWPPRRVFEAMAYDAVRKRWVLFGGYPAIGLYLNDTWEWDGNTWQQQSPLVSPPARRGALMTFDGSTGQVVLVSGYDKVTWFQDTWTYDGKTWTQIGTALPPNTYPEALAYDALRERLVMFGTPSNRPYSSLAEWDGSAWNLVPQTLAPDIRGTPALAFDRGRNKLVLFGGYSRSQIYADTWELSTTYPAGFTKLGQGCPGSRGVPELAIEPSGYPWLASTLRAEVRNLGLSPSQHLPFALLGDSKTALGTIPLPLDLTALGMPSCSLYTNALLTFPLVNQGGSALWALPIPADLTLAGRSFYSQAGSLDPASNPRGVVLSNAGELKVGWR